MYGAAESSPRREEWTEALVGAETVALWGLGHTGLTAERLLPPGGDGELVGEREDVTEGVLTTTEEEKGGLYSHSSTLTLSKALWVVGEVYTCRVTHYDTSDSAAFRRTGSSVRPTVSLPTPSSEQLSGGSATLACLLSCYSLQGAMVSWELSDSVQEIQASNGRGQVPQAVLSHTTTTAASGERRPDECDSAREEPNGTTLLGMKSRTT
ncbi:unnamed protein product, partial [Coregonus sp. 'balchen']